MSNRKKAMAGLEKNLRDAAPGNISIDMLLIYLNAMSDKQFKDYVTSIKNGASIPLQVENMSDQVVDIDKMMKVGKRLGVKFHQRITIVDNITGEITLTPDYHRILLLPCRRLVQHLTKKRGITADSKHTDHLSGQATGESKGASISAPELFIIDAGEYNNVAYETTNVLGGNAKAYRAMNKSMNETGNYSLEAIDMLGSNTKASETFEALLFARNLDNNLIEKS